MNKTAIALIIFFFVTSVANSQVIGFRFSVNSSAYITELGDSDVPHPYAIQQTPAIYTLKYERQPTIGAEAEFIYQVSPMSHFGIELEYSKLKGYNNTPPYYNYFLTTYFDQFQDEFIMAPVEFTTTLLNVAANWKYFLANNKKLRPFVKLTGVLSFLGTDFTYKELPDDFLESSTESDILYSRGTSNSDQDKLPVFHFGGGIGVDYKLNKRWCLQADFTSTIMHSDIVNGVPNFTYDSSDEDLLVYNKRLSVTAQISFGIVYYIEVVGTGKNGSGKIHPKLPFYRVN